MFSHSSLERMCAFVVYLTTRPPLPPVDLAKNIWYTLFFFKKNVEFWS